MLSPISISAAVGAGPATNLLRDQQIVLDRLRALPPSVGGMIAAPGGGLKDRLPNADLANAIKNFQRINAIDPRYIDGIVDKDKRTIHAINKLSLSVNASEMVTITPAIDTQDLVQPGALKFEVSSSIKVLGQPLPMSCWATVSTMFIKVKNPSLITSENIPVDAQIHTALGTLQKSAEWIGIYERKEGLPSRRNFEFYSGILGLYCLDDTLGVNFQSNNTVSRGALFWLSTLRTLAKPILCNTFRLPDGINDNPNHIVTIIGIDAGKETPNSFAPSGFASSPRGTVTILNTNPGVRNELSTADLDFLLASADGADGSVNARKRAFF